MMLDYEEPVFRPPSEAYSLILQVTYGCTWNKCAFCEMYPKKKFRTRNIDDVVNEIKDAAKYASDIRKVFLCDGNPMCLSTGKLLKVLCAVKEYLPQVRRVSAYALPADILRKSDEELKELYDAGLKLLYVGIESGDDELLKLIDKGETFKSTVEGLVKAQAAGMQNSVMIINGLGGKKYYKQHALNSANILNAIQPFYASTLVLSFPFGVERFRERFKGEYEEMSIRDLLEEMKIFIGNMELNGTIFRSDHASNYLVLKGVLSKDKDRMLNDLEFALNNPEMAKLRPEWMRGL
ncbi:radical SAM protein [Bacteroidota bacterium]